MSPRPPESPPAPSTPPPAPPSLDGVWLPIRGEFAGATAPELIITRTELTLREGAYTVRFEREIADAGRFTLVPSAPAGSAHAFLTLTGTTGQNAGRTIPCIYQLAGDRLRICYGIDGRRPDEFSTKPDAERYLMLYRRRTA